MRKSLSFACAICFVVTSVVIFTTSKTSAAEAAPAKNVVATVSPLATDAGIAAFEAGGNAIDAAVAAALTLGVVDGHNSGIGGGCFVLIRLANGEVIAIDGRETAPAKATRDMYLRDGVAQPELSQLGPLAVGVPGALGAYAYAIENYGNRELADVLNPAADIAEQGFKIDRVYAAKLKSTASRLKRFEGSRAVLLNADGEPFAEGDTLRQPDLARTYREVAKHGVDWFYKGEFAQTVGDWMAANGGILSAEDFAAFQPKLREPIRTTYREFEVIGFPPPSSGGVHVAQILNILEKFELGELYQKDPALALHVVAEAMKLAFADRAYWLGDPDFVNVPRGLIDQDYADRLANRIQLDKAIVVEKHSTPDRSDYDFFGKKHTTHLTAADAEGNWVAITATVNTTFGSKVIVPGTGVVLNNEMDDFSIQPGVPNAFGLVGADANAVEAGKRPLSSMSPTIVLKDGRPVVTVGAAGGPKIITQVVLGIINHLDFGMSISDALAAPRIHHQWYPDQLQVERKLPESVVKKLQELGHKVVVESSMGVSQGISRSQADQELLTGASDPRVPGKTAGTNR